ncbi:MAG: NAD(P)/FAD-dependent oxidoreductase [Candidatus Omnitrophica bacterium]|nr:NAD(P)/FAD-dependent oxidoreductase [Candidatus Omnitrophota bacterium]
MYDLAIIGAGPAGISAAKSALAAGLKSILIDKSENAFGGVCLNQGCIPTKFFIQNSNSSKSWSDLLVLKQALIEKIKLPIIGSLKKQGLDIIFGEASFVDKNTLAVNGEKVLAKNIIIASGSLSKDIFKSSKTISVESVLDQKILADNILIIGAGYVGVELSSLLHKFGKKVLLIEKENQILPSFDSQLSSRLEVILKRQGVELETGVDANKYDFSKFSMIVQAVGRSPSLEGLKLENAAVLVDGNGWIKTDNYLKTSQDNIYACGDVIGKRLLAYVAEYQGRLAVDNISGKNILEDYSGLPECVFSQPQLAKVGILEAEAKLEGINFKVIKSNFLKFSSAHVYDDSDGFMKVLIDDQGKIIGAGIISKHAGELISIFSLCIKNQLNLNDLKKCLFIHPTLSEIIPLLVQ